MSHRQTLELGLKSRFNLETPRFPKQSRMLHVGVTGTMEMWGSLWDRTPTSDMNIFQTDDGRGLIWYRWKADRAGGRQCGNGGRRSFCFFGLCLFSIRAPGYLVGTFPDEGGDFGHHQVHTFQAGLFQFADLLFHYSLKGQVRGEQPRSEGVRVMQEVWGC